MQYMVSGCKVNLLDNNIKILSKTFSNIEALNSYPKSICYISNIEMPLQPSVNDLISTVAFDYTFKQSKRMTAYYGSKDYAYSNTHHAKYPISTNPFIKSCIDEINMTFPGALVNTVLLNYYPDGDATIPFHSDNEFEICDDSFIFTYSIGHTRTLVFRDISSKKHLCKISLEHNSLIFFTKSSQLLYEHSIISKTMDCKTTCPRISLTFRKIN